MARSIYIASPNAGTGKSTVALGLVSCLTKVVAKVGVFRPFVESREGDAFLSRATRRRPTRSGWLKENGSPRGSPTATSR